MVQVALMAISNKQKRILVVILAVIAAYICVYTSNSRIFHTENRVHDESNLNERSNCWKTTTEKNKINNSHISPHTMLCLFEPISAMDYQRIDKKTVVIGVGVHLGPAAIGKHSIPYADIEYISWEYRDKQYNGNQQYLIHGFSNDHLLKMQKIFWDLYQGDKDLQRADIIVCGFDAWHCLIFAPFNKKLVIDSAYRFDGHIGIDGANQIELQKRLYEAVRYNPDVIIAGEIVYDVAYSQHFLGSHKIIPLPADGEYVLQRLKNELEQKSDMICRNVPIISTGYHPTIPFTITVGPKRLSGGGSKVADEIYQYFQKRPGKYKVDIMKKHMKQPYKYCDLGRYSAMIVLGYSVMSFFTLECSALGIPMFVPTPRLYAEWEKKYHLIRERKGPLQQRSFDYMKQNSRSLNFGKRRYFMVLSQLISQMTKVKKKQQL